MTNPISDTVSASVGYCAGIGARCRRLLDGLGVRCPLEYAGQQMVQALAHAGGGD
jgi:hypothetical protein